MTSDTNLAFLCDKLDQLLPRQESKASPYIILFWKPLHIPSAHALDIFNDNLKSFKVNCGHSIEADIEQYEGPLEECIDRVSCAT